MTRNNNKVFVIGSNSFTGATFIDLLLGAGCEVLGISRSSELPRVFLPYAWRDERAEMAEFCFGQFDLNTHTKAISEAIGDFKPSYVVNFSAQSMVAESWDYPEQWYQTNVVANVELHNRIRKFNFIKKYVHITTPEVYGDCSGYINESAPFNPSTPYAASRAACDMHLMTFFKNYNFPVVFTRAANVYGPGQQLYRIIPRTIFYIKTGKKLQLHGGGHSVRSFIHAKDVADGTLKVARDGIPGEAYHISTTSSVSIRELVEMICKRMGVHFGEFVEIVGDRPGKDGAYLLDSSKARENLAWKDKISLEDGIDQTIKWVEDNIDTLKQEPNEYIHKK
tara:strand:- start:2055 stop:3065 length:1011 start_codon:yes stop_codon:yes gene_type:complete